MKVDNWDVRVFTAIVDQGSLSGAACSLGVQKSTVSRKLALLEGRLGHRLVERSSRKTRLTDVGDLLLAHARRVMEEIEAAEAAIEALSAEPSGSLNVSLPHAIAQKLVLPMLPAFLERYPKIDIGLDLSVKNVDLIAEGFDLAIRVGDLPPSSLIARKLGNLPIILVAAPAYLAVAGVPESARDLERLDTIALGARAKSHEWAIDGPGGPGIVVIKARITVSEVGLVRDLVVAGMGIASLPMAFVIRDLADGKLVRVLPEVTRGAPPVHAIYPSRRLLAPKIKAFFDAIGDSLSEAHNYAANTNLNVGRG